MRRFLTTAACLLSTGCSQKQPTKPVECTVEFSPSGIPDKKLLTNATGAPTATQPLSPDSFLAGYWASLSSELSEWLGPKHMNGRGLEDLVNTVLAMRESNVRVSVSPATGSSCDRERLFETIVARLTAAEKEAIAVTGLKTPDYSTFSMAADESYAFERWLGAALLDEYFPQLGGDRIGQFSEFNKGDSR